ncbi:hypothetical protein ACXET9_05320 [Brachybacterium sp. DNPG3]
MTTYIRRSTRALAVGIGAVALSVGAAACSSGGDEGTATTDAEVTAEETTAEETTAEETTEDQVEETTEETSEETDETDETDETGSDDAASGDVTDEDLSAAKSQVLGFLGALGDQDAEAACSFAINAATGEPYADDELAACGEQIESTGMMDVFTPELVALVTEDTLTAEANEDGTITVGASGSSQMVLTKASDGNWYVSGSVG